MKNNSDKLRDCNGLMHHTINLNELKKLEGTTIDFPLSPTGRLEICDVGEAFSNCKWGSWMGDSHKYPTYSRVRGSVPNWLISSFLINNKLKIEA